MSDYNSSPVSLPAGSFDYDKLMKATDKAAKGPETKYQDNVQKALVDAAPVALPVEDTANLPGYRKVEVEHAELGVTEEIRVFDPKLAEKEEPKTDAITSEETQHRTARQAPAEPKE